jgi:hypothetical protein
MIKRIVELVLDKAAADRAAREAQDALKKGTDPATAERNLGLVGRAMDRIKSAAFALGGALAAAFSLRAIANFGTGAVRAATEAGATWNRLAGQLEATGTAFVGVEAEIRAAARAMQDTTTVGDEEFAEGLTELVSITGDYRGSLAEMQTVADLAAAKQIDLKTAAQLVGKAMIGETGTLARYGIVVQEGADAMDVLRDRFRGMSENEASTLKGVTEQLGNEWGDLKEAIGDAMIEAGSGTGILSTMIGTVRGLTTWVNENRSEIANWGRLVIRTFQAVFESVQFMARIVGNSFDIIGSSITMLLLHMRQNLATTVNNVIEAFNRIPGVNIDFRMNNMTPFEFEAAQRELVKNIEGDTLDMQDAVLDLAEAYKEVGVAAMDAARGQREAASAAADDGGGGAPAGLAIPELGKRTPGAHDFLGGVEVRILDPQPIQSDRERIEAELAKLQESAENVAGGMSEAFAGFFEASRSGFEDQGGVFAAAADAARGAGAAIVSELVRGRAEAEYAQGVAALAAGTWPPNPAAFAAAGKHFLAASLFQAIPGVIRGAARGGGGGGGGSSIPRGGVGTSVPGAREVAGAEVHIYIDALSPADPRFQRVVLGATQNAQERFGESVRVNIHPRT